LLSIEQGAIEPLVVYFGTANRGKGIHVFTLDQKTGHLAERGATEIQGRGWIDLDPTGRYLYAATDPDRIDSFAVDQTTGLLTALNSSPTGTSSVSHLSVDPTSRFVVGASYSGGAACVVAIAEDGSLRGPTNVVPHVPGLGDLPGPHPDQTQAKAHQCPFDPSGKWVVVNDLGLDRTYVYGLDTSNGKLVPNDPPYIQFARGRGPRHIAFHPGNRYAYVINELNSELTALHWDPVYGTFEEIQTESTLPEGWTGRKWSAQVVVHPSGAFVYGSNRGSGRESDDIAIFRIDESTGRISLAGHADSGGQVARNFNIDPSGRFLICVNQDSDNAVVFRIDQMTGMLTSTGQHVRVVNAVCTQFGPSIG
jgi:6-phosphogluconolactonase